MEWGERCWYGYGIRDSPGGITTNDDDDDDDGGLVAGCW